ncbi:hypothetical protein JTE90_009707 [Oedothorax gibbosus]|uniref:Uncharacterized protein n=1 Tax=Oedothorax gibbosus TaxID=931172 RepID=A0AAV6V7S7_9ARAC|nr:hypothetical protein JTE90_009707 [Oedothorax gibbosus]
MRTQDSHELSYDSIHFGLLGAAYIKPLHSGRKSGAGATCGDLRGLRDAIRGMGRLIRLNFAGHLDRCRDRKERTRGYLSQVI